MPLPLSPLPHPHPLAHRLPVISPMLYSLSNRHCHNNLRQTHSFKIEKSFNIEDFNDHFASHEESSAKSFSLTFAEELLPLLNYWFSRLCSLPLTYKFFLELRTEDYGLWVENFPTKKVLLMRQQNWREKGFK